MNFGLWLSTQHLDGESPALRFAEHAEQVRLARSVGFSSIWVSQHYLAAPFLYFEPIPTLARLAAEAAGMWVGTNCLLLPLHHPLQVAEQLATLDVLSGGRLIFGVGLGHRDVENLAMGHEPTRRVRRLEEGLEVIERLWQGAPVTYEGREFALQAVQISLRPLQRPRPPIWLGASSEAGIRRAARLGDTWLISQSATLPVLERQLALFFDERRDAGRPPSTEVPLSRECCVAPLTSTAVAESRPFLEVKYGAYRQWNLAASAPSAEAPGVSFEEFARDRFILGDPTRVREEIARYRERLGVTTLILRVQWPGMEQATVLRSIRLLGEAVLPPVG